MNNRLILVKGDIKKTLSLQVIFHQSCGPWHYAKCFIATSLCAIRPIKKPGSILKMTLYSQKKPRYLGFSL